MLARSNLGFVGIFLLSTLMVAACGDDGGKTTDHPDAGPDATVPHMDPDASYDASPDARPDATPPSECGNGAVEIGEACDDGGTAANDGCSATCAIETGYACTGAPSVCATVCGDSIVVGAETCDDGANMPSDGCDSQCASEPGYTCTGAPSVCTPVCGDMIIIGGEACDDGGTLASDGCSATCTVEPGYACTGTPSVCSTVCGDSILAGSEACDDGGIVANDGCSATCTVDAGYTCTGTPSHCTTLCGDSIVAGAESCDDGGTHASDGCSASCLVEPGYACTGAPSVCATVCGDSIIAGSESCDDGNSAAGDCCNNCAAEPGCETEVNNTSAAADPVDTHFINDVVTGTIAPVGDVDFYVLTLPAGAAEYTLHLETLDGFANVCTSNHIDSFVTLMDSTGATLASDDDTGAGYCSLFDFGVMPGIYFVSVAASPSAGANNSFDYRLRMVATAVVCGDGTRNGHEQCDDGNIDGNDGCSATCTIESISETENNNTPGTANGPLGTRVPVLATIDPIGDKDYFSFVVPNFADVALETFDSTGPPSCGTTVDTLIRMFAPDGTTELVSDDDDGPGNCSTINPVSDAAVRRLAPGTYFVSVEDFGNNGTVPGYLLYLHFTALCGDGVVAGSEECDGGPTCTSGCERIPVCGDGFIDAPETCDDGNATPGDGCSAICQREQVCGNGNREAPEACDDGNTAAGDGCSASCTIEAGHAFESEPNGTFATANATSTALLMHAGITPAGDKDFFSFVVSSYSDVVIETFDGTGPLNCAANVDTLIRLLAPNGTTELVNDNDDGPAKCSMITAATDAAARHLAPGTYFVAAQNFSASAVLAAYTLRVSFSAVCGDGVVAGSEECDGGPTCTDACERVPVCGDGFIDTPEECDDSNTATGDGCDATCQREPRCGDGFVDAPETCDDGNVAPGDGCDAMCATEMGHAFEVEPNNNAGTANVTVFGSRIHAAITPIGDRDYYRIKLNAPGSLRIETFDTNPALNSCVAIDTLIRLYSADGTTEIFNDDDDGPGNCSKIDGTTDTQAMNLAAGTYFLAVEEFGNNGLIPGYQLVITLL